LRPCAAIASQPEALTLPSLRSSFWRWRDYDIRYTYAGTSGPALLLVHGFGGNAEHWRKNIRELAACGFRVWAIDLLGYGFSSKPAVDPAAPAALLNFDTWGEQLTAFGKEVVGEPCFMACNSVGGLAALAAAAAAAAAPGAGGSAAAVVRGIVLLNVSLRELHLSKQPALLRPFVAALQSTLRTTPLGAAFFSQVAQPLAVRNVLREAYGSRRDEAVSPELVQAILTPGLQPGAPAVFLDFISYSSGPLAEELIPVAGCPVLLGWGAGDPWERLEKAQPLYAGLPNVEGFTVFPGLGHCPQDEDPAVVNPFIAAFVRKHSREV
jgi:pimeloyl-ACP methyl ester carboxylesterase